MAYFNYHGKAKRLLKDNKLIGYYYTENHNGIKPCLVLIFDDEKHHVMPIRKDRWQEYFYLLDSNKQLKKD